MFVDAKERSSLPAALGAKYFAPDGDQRSSERSAAINIPLLAESRTNTAPSQDRGQAKQTTVTRRVPRKASSPIPPPRWTYHRVRRLIQVGCFVVFVLLPFFNVMRFDIPRQRFYFAGYELWINEFAIIFFSLMFLLFVIVAVSMIYGRLYCGYACPQMIFSEASLQMEQRLRNWINKKRIKWPARRRRLFVAALFYSTGALASIFLAFVFISYFVEPRDLFRRLLALDVQTAGGIAGAVTTLIVFVDFAFLRQRFCTTVCPYGYLQGLLGDDDTLIVEYRDPQQECIECKKCIRVCHMGIDIRKSPYQIECIHCGECVDACVDIMGKLGKKTLIEYHWGDQQRRPADMKGSRYRRLGLRNAKQVVVMFVILFYAGGLFVALSMRRDVLLRIAPVRASLYRVGDDGRIYNKFRITVANRGHKEATVQLSSTLPDAQLLLKTNPIAVRAGETQEQEFEISVAPDSLPQGVNHFVILGGMAPSGDDEKFSMTFIMPANKDK